MKAFKHFIIVIIALTMASSCAKLDELSDDNTISSLSISSHRPAQIDLGATQIEGDTIFIPVIYGKYAFPLYFTADLKVDPNIDKVLGIDFSRELCLQSLEDQLKFFVMAKSGRTRIYYIRAKEVPLDENNYILNNVSVSSGESSALFSPLATRSMTGDTIKIASINTTFPITITPTFTIADDATFRNFDNGTTSLSFNTPQSTHRLKVISQSGSERIWNIKLQDLPLVNGSTSGAYLQSTAIDPRRLQVEVGSGSATTDVAITESYVENKDNSIRIVIDDKVAAAARKSSGSRGTQRAVTLPGNGFDVLIKFPIMEGIATIGYQPDVPIHFDAVDQIKEFYLLDPIAGIARKWSVALEPYIQNQAQITNFTFTYSATDVKVSRSGPAWNYKYTYQKSIVLNPNFLEIYPNEGKIYVKATSIAAEWYTDGFLSLGSVYNYDWKLTITPKMTLSKGATASADSFTWISNLTPGVAGIGTKANDCWKNPVVFNVTAEDGTVKQWSIHILTSNESVTGTQSELLEFGIAKLMPNYTVLDPTTPIIRDDDAKTITIKLQEDDESYPLTITPTYKVSEFAKITTPLPLVFNNAKSELPLTIESLDGKSTESWRVKLLAPTKAVGADIETFSITTLSPEQFKFQKSDINKQTGLITLYLDSDGKYPLTTNYRMTLSAGATSGETALTGSLEFAFARQTKSITVTAQNGEQKLWIVALDYRPQLTNGNLNSWIDDKTPSAQNYWATANNSMVTGTTRSTGFSGAAGDYAPLMSTSSTAGKLAAGTIFTGYFIFNSGIGMSDPVALTYQGITFAPTAKIKAVELDVKYNPAGGDCASLVAELIYWDGRGSYVYHGDKPTKINDNKFTSSPHSENTALSVAKKQIIIGMNAGTSKFGTPVVAVERDKWTKMTIEMPYGTAAMPNFTHINVICGSSVYGDLFIGDVGTKLQIDNVRIIYE